MQQAEALCPKRRVEHAHARDIAARAAQALDRPRLTGSSAAEKIIGIVDVAFFAASADGGPPAARTAATRKPTSSAASAGNRS